jgi:putative DNA primase/helicase
MTPTNNILPDNNEIGVNNTVATSDIPVNHLKVTRQNLVTDSSLFNTVSLESIVNEIRNASLKSITEECQKLYVSNPVSYKLLKKTLPCVAFSGTFKTSVININIDVFSGLMVVDIDKTDVAQTRLLLESMPSCVVCFASPSGAGVKAVMNIGISTTAAEYSNKFEKLTIYLAEKGINLDPTGKDVKRACFLCYDPDVYFNYQVEVLDLSNISLPVKAIVSLTDKENPPPHPARIESALAFCNYLYETWSKAAAAIGYDLDYDIGFDLFHRWSQKDQNYQSEQDCRDAFDSYKHSTDAPVTCGTIFHMAHEQGWDNSIDPSIALNYINDGELADIANQIACLMSEGLNARDKGAVIDQVIERFHLGQVKTELSRLVGLKVAELMRNIKPKAITVIVPTTETLSTNIFPDKHISITGNVKLKSTRENFERMLTAYGITYTYNIINKEAVVRIPGFVSTNPEAINQELISLCARNELPERAAEHIVQLLEGNMFNPVIDHIESMPWDKRSRLQELFDTVRVGVGYEAIKEPMLKVWLLQCVAAADHGNQSPNEEKFHKFEHIFVLQGHGGVKKSTWFRQLMPAPLQGYFSDGINLNLNSKDSVIEAIKYWVIELGELGATFRRSDIDALKAFASKRYDEIRAPYGKRAIKSPRTTSMCGSVNPSGFLRDLSGNRRYWTLNVTALNPQHGIDMQQLWAEVYHEYLDGEAWWGDADFEALIMKTNDLHLDKSPFIELLELTIDFTKPNAGKFFSTPFIQNEMDKRQIECCTHTAGHYIKSNTMIALNNWKSSSEINTYMQQRGFLEITINGKRGYRLTLHPTASTPPTTEQLDALLANITLEGLRSDKSLDPRVEGAAK